MIVELTFGAIKHLATLNEISRTGAKLSGVSPLAEGQELVFRAGTVQALGEVVWSTELPFDTKLGALHDVESTKDELCCRFDVLDREKHCEPHDPCLRLSFRRDSRGAWHAVE